MQSTSHSSDTEVVLQRYQDNFSRHLLVVARHLQTETMNALQRERGHKHLRLGFAPYISLIGQQGKRLSDLALTLGISRQACNQAANQIEAAGYIERCADPSDGRAKTLRLTRQGVKLRRDGAAIVSALDREFVLIAGKPAVEQASTTLREIHRRLALGLPGNSDIQVDSTALGGLLPLVSDYMLQRLMLLTRKKGHPGLKLSFGQVLTLIGPGGGRMQQMATIQDISKQAVGVIATELEHLGYLKRQSDPRDARQVLLKFTKRGHGLISDSVASVDELEAEFEALTDVTAITQMKATLAALYHALNLEQEVFTPVSGTNIAAMAQQLRQQLGAENSKALGHLLINAGDKGRQNYGR
ncbi:MAG: MarR family transcriptional regulator [Halioglobus sp.]